MTDLPDSIRQILSQYDAGQHDVAALATACSVSPGYVYGALRSHRPKRARKPRTRTSQKRLRILLLHNVEGVGVAEVARRVGVTNAYVYRVLSDFR